MIQPITKMMPLATAHHFARVVMMLVGVMVVADHFAGVMRVGGKTSRGDRGENRGLGDGRRD